MASVFVEEKWAATTPRIGLCVAFILYVAQFSLIVLFSALRLGIQALLFA